jgi:hypothetical protein
MHAGTVPFGFASCDNRPGCRSESLQFTNNAPGRTVFERISNRVFVLLLLLLGAFALSFVDAARLRDARLPALDERAALVEALRLSDLCLFTEARYTRHPAQADLHSPFQDHPFAFEHFPTGSLLLPPPHMPARAGHAVPAAGSGKQP